MRNENLTPDEVEKVLNKQSGVLGVSDISADFRDIEDEAAKGNEKSDSCA